jgi:hypothetical protein
MKKVTFGLLGALAVATTVILVRQQKVVEAPDRASLVPAGETQPATISLERMRELGL